MLAETIDTTDVTVSETMLPRINQELSVLVVDPDPRRRGQVKTQLRALDLVKMTGARNTPHFLIDVLWENPIDVVLFDEQLGMENILDAVRDARMHPMAENMGFVLAAERVTPELIRVGSQVGILGYLKRPFTPKALKQALLQSLGEVNPCLRPALQHMRRARFFSGFTDRELLRLLNICPVRQLDAGEYVFHEGEKGETLYVLLDGEIAIRRGKGAEEKTLVVLSAGTTFGEMAILDNDPRSADAVAARQVSVFEINHATLNRDDSLLSLKLARQIAIELANKIRSFNYQNK